MAEAVLIGSGTFLAVAAFAGYVCVMLPAAFKIQQSIGLSDFGGAFVFVLLVVAAPMALVTGVLAAVF